MKYALEIPLLLSTAVFRIFSGLIGACYIAKAAVDSDVYPGMNDTLAQTDTGTPGHFCF